MLEATTPLELTVRITGFPYDHHICLPLGLLEPSSGNRRVGIAEGQSQSGNLRVGIAEWELNPNVIGFRLF